MSSAKTGQSAVLAMEKDGDAAGTFTDIAELTDDFNFEMSRDSTDITPHGDTIDSHIFGYMKRGPINFSGNFIHDNATQDAATGLQKRFHDGDTFGLMFKGSTWSSGTDEVIVSGQLVNFQRTAGPDASKYGFSASFQPSGKHKVDGTEYGTVN